MTCVAAASASSSRSGRAPPSASSGLPPPRPPLIVINSSMVDPHWFTGALYRLRPELRPGAADELVDDEAYAASV